MNEYNPKEIAQRIWKLREENGFTREVLAERANLSGNFIYEVETNRRGLSADSMFSIAQSLSVSLGFLVTGKAPHKELNSIIELLSVCTPKQLRNVESIILNALELNVR